MDARWTALVIASAGLLACNGAIGDTAADPPARPGGRSLPTAEMCTGVAASVAPGFIRRLGALEYAHAVSDVFGVDVDVRSVLVEDAEAGGFSSNAGATVGALEVAAYERAASIVAEAVRGNLRNVHPCAPAAATPGARNTCASEIFASTARRLFREVPSEGVLAPYTALYDAAVEGAADDSVWRDAVVLVLSAMLSSPRFLYQTEIGRVVDGRTDIVALTPLELATRLSFALWRSVPDEPLLQAAESDALLDPAVLRETALRMLDDEKARRAIADFHRQWLWIDGNHRGPIEAEGIAPTAVDAMREEVGALASSVILDGDGSFEALMTAPFSFVNEELAAVYGIDGVTGPELRRVELDPTERAGVLTLPAFLAAHSHATEPSATLRGQFVRSVLLCQRLPEPPAELPEPPSSDVELDRRAVMELHLSTPACAGCHEMMDPIGFGFEHFDEAGRFRLRDERDRVIDDTGEIVDSSDETLDGEFAGVPELAARLASSELARGCYADSWFGYLVSRSPAEDDACSVSLIHRAFEDSGHDIRELVAAVVTSDAFRHRRVSEETSTETPEACQ